MSVNQADGESGQQIFAFFQEAKVSAFLDRKYILFQKGCLFPGIRLSRPLPVLFIAPISGVGKRRFEFGPVTIPSDTAAAMIEVQMGEKHVRDIGFLETF